MAKVKQLDAVSVAEAVERLPGLAVESDEDTLRRAVRVEDERGVPQLAVVPWDLFDSLRTLATLLQDPEEQAKKPYAVHSILTYLRYKYDLSDYGPDPSQAWFRTPGWQAGMAEAEEELRRGQGTTYYSDEEFLEALDEM